MNKLLLLSVVAFGLVSCAGTPPPTTPAVEYIHPTDLE